MKKYSIGVILLVISLGCFSQGDSLQARLILIGDGGEFKAGKQPVIDAVKQTFRFDKKTSVIFLGDNLYPEGMLDEQSPSYTVKTSILDTQIAIGNGTDAQVFFLPGNHDWGGGAGGRWGWEAVVRQERYINTVGGKNVRFYPENGCPGPVEVELSRDVTMIIFDSQWWIHPYDKPGIESDCEFKTKEEVLAQIDELLEKNAKKLVFLACHHPFKSYGIHGGYFKLKQHIFPFTDLNPKLYIPLPLIGSIYPIARGVFGVQEDLRYPAYANMIKDVQEVARKHPNLVFVSGHEHNLQYIKDSSYNYIVSGSAAKSTRVSSNKKAPFTSMDNGFAVLEVNNKKDVNLAFYTLTDSTRKVYDTLLLNFSKLPAPKFEDTIPIVYVPYAADSISVAANAHYAQASKLMRFFNGNNYRSTWAEPVKLKVFRVKEEMGGLKVGELGGGHQTKSIKLTDTSGREWSLRTVNKDISQVLPPGIKGSLAEDYLQDFISTAHPYSPVIVPTLAKAINVAVATPKFYFIPNDPALGVYRPYFANTVCMIEQREPVPRGRDTKSQQKLMNKMLDDNDDIVDQKAFLRARLLDFLISDWDRHFDQWRFAETDTGKGKLYYPIPRDRDQAFSRSDGMLIKLVKNSLLPFLGGFKKEPDRIKWLAYWGKDLDRMYLNRLDSSVWRRTLADFRRNLTDEVINKAVKNLPPEIFALDGRMIAETLKSRRNGMLRETMKYYKFLSRTVNIAGSNQREYFKIESAGKNLKVRVYEITSKTDSNSLIYERVFEPAVTKEINLYGLNGNDIFDVDRNARSGIKLRIIGGRGEDTFNIKGRVENSLYDLSLEKNVIENHRRSKNRFESDPSVNRYSPTGFSYNVLSYPNISLGFNGEDGLIAGAGFSKKTFGFRKVPYSTFQKLNALYALGSGAYRFKYMGEFNEVLGKNDVVINAEAAKPVLNNFFGLGNDSKVDPGQEVTYYRVRYNYVSADILLRRRLTGFFNVSIGPTVYNYWNHLSDNRGKILNAPSLVGLDSAAVYKTKVYGGGKLLLQLNTINNVLLPTRGLLWNTEFSALGGLNKNSNALTSLTSDMTLYSSLSDPARVVSILKLGGGHIFSKNYEYFQALNLGQNNFLRGFRKNRFSGSSLAYGSLSLLVKLFDTKSYILPGSVGLIGFDDIGRVWASDKKGNAWHNSIGGGLYFSPFNMVLLSATAGFSKEETLFNISIGTKLNLTF